MAVTSKVSPLDREIGILVDETLSPQARSKLFAEFAHDQIEIAKADNAKVLGRVPPYTVAVDGRIGASLTSVRPDGVIFVEFTLLEEVLIWIGRELVERSPVGTPPKDRHPGLYADSHKLYADGLEITFGMPLPMADEYAFVNSVPYARKIERGLSSQAPDGVYQAVAVMARGRFGNIAKIAYSFRTITGGERNPAVVVRTYR